MVAITEMQYPNRVITNNVGGNVEYPKWIYPNGLPGFIVKNAEEEAIGMATAKVVESAPAPIIEPVKKELSEDEQKAILIDLASEKDIDIKKSWDLDRIKKELEKYKI